jgi:SdrD B-like domain
MEAALVNLVIFRPAPACARHARKKFHYCLILWVVGLVAAFSLTFSQQAIGASGLTPDPGSPTIPASVSGVVFYDANQNGKLDSNEYAISGGNIELYQGNNLYATTKVNDTGQYFFKNLPAGNYSIHNTTDGTWLPVPGVINSLNSTSIVNPTDINNDGEIDNVVLTAGDQAQMYNFAAQYYPIQLLSKRMLLASAGPGSSGNPLIIAVPEPATAVMLGFAAIAFILMAARRRFCKN